MLFALWHLHTACTPRIISEDDSHPRWYWPSLLGVAGEAEAWRWEGFPDEREVEQGSAQASAHFTCPLWPSSSWFHAGDGLYPGGKKM